MNQTQEMITVADKSLIYLVSGMNEDSKTEILESVFFAQLGAKTSVSPQTDAIGWYKAYNDVLSQKGWTIERGEVQQFAATGTALEIQTAITDILTNASGGAFVPIANNAIDAIRFLAAASGKNGAFEKNAPDATGAIAGNIGSFQLAVARQEGRKLSINLGTLLLTSANKIKQMLFLKFTKDVSVISYLSGKLTPDEIVYEHTRKLIQQKLNDKAAQLAARL
jgi:hypothetical protein